jgi:hypothetical protein
MARGDSELDKTDRQLLEELAQRARRTETRTTKIANHLGIDAGGEKPYVSDGVMYVPSLKVSLQEVVDAIGNIDVPIPVYCGGDFIVKLNV